MNIVIGSGPAGISCAQALLSQGKKVLLLDGGHTLEAEPASVASALARMPAAQWPPDQRDFLKGRLKPDPSGLVDKLHFGSDYPYRQADEKLGLDRRDVGLKASLATGGLSTVWGASMMPIPPHDMKGWPIDFSDLAAHYEAVSRFVPMAAERDALAEKFPLGIAEPGYLEMSRQMRWVREVMDRHRQCLTRAGFHHGRSRIGVRASASGGLDGCSYCGFCMYGCPYGHIYNAASTIPELKKNPHFSHRAGWLVTALQSDEKGVTVMGENLADHSRFTLSGSRVFLAAGTLATTKLLLQTLGIYDRQVPMLDSQYFVMPLLSWRSAGKVRSEKLYGLNQLFLEYIDPRKESPTIHMELYPRSEMMGEFVKMSFGPLAGILDPLVEFLENRLVVLQGFLHSNFSRGMRLELTKNAAGADVLRVEPGPRNPQMQRVLVSLLWKMHRYAWQLGAVPLIPKMQVPQVGRSYHCGGSFPMMKNPTAKSSALASDILGRPVGLERIHAVDATVFPEIAATTITFPVMANAHRIGTLAAALDEEA